MKNPQTFNRYSYAMNSPYKFVDPLGLVSRPERSLVDPSTLTNDSRMAPAGGTDPIVKGGRANSTPSSVQPTDPPGSTHIDPGPVAAPGRRDASSDPTGPPVRPQLLPKPLGYTPVLAGTSSVESFINREFNGQFFDGNGAFIDIQIKENATGNIISDFEYQRFNDSSYDENLIPADGNPTIPTLACEGGCNPTGGGSSRTLADVPPSSVPIGAGQNRSVYIERGIETISFEVYVRFTPVAGSRNNAISVTFSKPEVGEIEPPKRTKPPPPPLNNPRPK
jgi:hypothetical protein